MRRAFVFCLFGALATLPGLPLVHAEDDDGTLLTQMLQWAGAPVGDTAPDALLLSNSATRDQQLPLYRTVMAQPLNAPYRLGVLADAFKTAQTTAHELVSLAGAAAGLRVSRSPETALNPLQTQLRAAADPLVASLAWMAPKAKRGSAWPPTLPTQAQLPGELRFELAMVLAAMGQSQQFLQRALARLPAGLTPTLLRRQALSGELQLFEAPDYRSLLPLIERETLLAGMQDLVAATERLKRVASTTQLPAVALTLNTPMGQIVVDTTGRNNQYRLQDPLLVLDVGGDDDYDFLPRSDSHRISVLLDHLGNDRYSTRAPGADPSSATLGYGILWDTEGDDHYLGRQQAQAAALFGAALLVDGGGSNVFVASGYAQAHAIGGLAVLHSSAGQDSFTAQTHAQGSAGPLGVALLLNPGGDDSYMLSNTPLVLASPQLPDRNASMGQGAGRGVRGDGLDGRSTAGGIGLLIDLAGDDHYSAQVFAQGVGYQQGLGLLVDDGGNDHFEAAWYGLGAAAHQGAGVLLKRGTGHDHYQISHSTSLGAAHDLSVAIFVDEGGNDHYALGDLGLGAAHANGTALFVDGGGDDSYQVSASACRALGGAYISQWGNVRESFLNLGLFMDLGGTDSYPAQCERVHNNTHWAGPRAWPQLKLRSEAGAGFDGTGVLPFALRALTPSPLPALEPK